MLHSSPVLMVFTLKRLGAVVFLSGVSAGHRAGNWHGQVQCVLAAVPVSPPNTAAINWVRVTSVPLCLLGNWDVHKGSRYYMVRTWCCISSGVKQCVFLSQPCESGRVELVTAFGVGDCNWASRWKCYLPLDGVCLHNMGMLKPGGRRWSVRWGGIRTGSKDKGENGEGGLACEICL